MLTKKRGKSLRYIIPLRQTTRSALRGLYYGDRLKPKKTSVHRHKKPRDYNQRGKKRKKSKLCFISRKSFYARYNTTKQNNCQCFFRKKRQTFLTLILLCCQMIGLCLFGTVAEDKGDPCLTQGDYL